MVESLEFQIARTKIGRYALNADAPLLRDSHIAQACVECEGFLDQGIAALTWLERAEQAVNEAALEGFDLDPQIDESLELLYAAWLRAIPVAERWISACECSGLTVSNAAAFRACSQRAHDWLDRFALYKRSKAARDERLAQEAW